MLLDSEEEFSTLYRGIERLRNEEEGEAVVIEVVADAGAFTLLLLLLLLVVVVLNALEEDAVGASWVKVPLAT